MAVFNYLILWLRTCAYTLIWSVKIFTIQFHRSHTFEILPFVLTLSAKASLNPNLSEKWRDHNFTAWRELFNHVITDAVPTHLMRRNGFFLKKTTDASGKVLIQSNRIAYDRAETMTGNSIIMQMAIKRFLHISKRLLGDSEPILLRVIH